MTATGYRLYLQSPVMQRVGAVACVRRTVSCVPRTAAMNRLLMPSLLLLMMMMNADDTDG